MKDYHFDAIFCEYRDAEEALKLPFSLNTVKVSLTPLVVYAAKSGCNTTFFGVTV